MTRTTINLDDDVALALDERARARGRSRSRVANELIRAGLQAGRGSMRLEPYEPPVFDTGQPLIDVTDVAAAIGILDDRS
jgi:hypothetical protein